MSTHKLREPHKNLKLAQTVQTSENESASLTTSAQRIVWKCNRCQQKNNINGAAEEKVSSTNISGQEGSDTTLLPSQTEDRKYQLI